MPALDDAIALAVNAHFGQHEMDSNPYILHPLRVMFRVEGVAARITAVLHDVVEDTSVTFDDLAAQGYRDEVLAALDCLTLRPAEPYEGMLQRIEGNALARRVKIADLEDNMDIRRLPEVTEQDAARLRKYRRAWERLQAIERTQAAR